MHLVDDSIILFKRKTLKFPDVHGAMNGSGSLAKLT